MADLKQPLWHHFQSTYRILLIILQDRIRQLEIPVDAFKDTNLPGDNSIHYPSHTLANR